MKPEKRTVDDRLPKWLHSKILSAVDFIYQSHGNVQESLERVKQTLKTPYSVNLVS